MNLASNSNKTLMLLRYKLSSIDMLLELGTPFNIIISSSSKAMVPYRPLQINYISTMITPVKFDLMLALNIYIQNMNLMKISNHIILLIRSMIAFLVGFIITTIFMTVIHYTPIAFLATCIVPLWKSFFIVGYLESIFMIILREYYHYYLTRILSKILHYYWTQHASM